MLSSSFTEHSNRWKECVQKEERREKKNMLVRATQLELEKSCGTCLEEGKAGDSSATSEAVALRRAAWREEENTAVRSRQLEREEKEKLLERG